MNGSALVMQSGGPTAVMNRSLFGLVDEAGRRGAFGALLGADHGIEGLLAGEVRDLGTTQGRSGPASRGRRARP